jgi:pyrimidine operon attenuation protein/uracil phosphoribosyltransferase
MTRRVADEQGVARLVNRLASAVERAHRGARELSLVGIKRRGVPLARRIAARLNRGRRKPVPVGAIDITLYRDDLKLVAETPIVRGSELGFDVNGRTIILVDDVIFTGRTIRAALTELLDFGRPRSVRLAVLIDRGHRELPLHPDFVGRVLSTGPRDLVDIFLKETDGRDGVYVTRR